MSRRVTLTQAIQETGFTYYTLSQWIKQGKIPFLRIGQGKRAKIILDLDLIEEFLKSEAVNNMTERKANETDNVVVYRGIRRVSE